MVGNSNIVVAPTESKVEIERRLKDSSAPAWATNARNCRGLISWDSAQYIGLLVIQDCLIEALFDTGAACTIMDLGTAKKLGMELLKADNQDFGCFSVPGRSSPQPYPAAIRGPVRLQLSQDVIIELPLIRLVDHGKPMFLLGADVLACEATPDRWEFYGMGP